MDVDDDDGRRTDLAGNGEHIIVGDERLQATITVLSITPLVGHVLSFLGYQGLARVACVAKRFRTLADVPGLWSPLLERSYGALLTNTVRAPKYLFSECHRSDVAVWGDHRRDPDLAATAGYIPPTYRFTRELYEGQHTPLCLDFDHRFFMSGHIDSTIKVWDSHSGAEVTKLEGHESWVKCLKFDERSVISGSYDAKLREWDIASWKTMAVYQGHGVGLPPGNFSPSGSVVCLDFSQTHILSGSNDTSVRLWKRFDRATSGYGWTEDEPSGGGDQMGAPSPTVIQPTLTLLGHGQTVRCLEFRRNIACTGGSDRLVRVWDLNTGQETHQLRKHVHRISCLQMTEDACMVISGSNDRTVRLWDLRVGGDSHVDVLKAHLKAVRRLQFDPDLRKIITGGDEPCIQAFDLRKMGGETGEGSASSSSLLCKFYPNNANASNARVSAMQYDAHRLACAFTLGHTDEEGNHHRRGAIKLWDMSRMEEVYDYRDGEGHRW
jgi:hypothetical protein